ncbi:MAG: hypothetical protein U5Q44_13645 [Dehalococcoidia bacterium]|nr:hypothetical protein [Dehalococcoidia bacterium]
MLAGVLGDHLGEACRRLVAVRNALYDRRYSMAVSLMDPLPGLAEWRDFAQWAAIVPPENMLRDLGLGEEALPAAEKLHEQADLAWVEPLVAAHASGNSLIIYTRVGSGKAPTTLWMGPVPTEDGESLSISMEEHDAATLADMTADMVGVARGFLGSYLKARQNAGRRED